MPWISLLHRRDLLKVGSLGIAATLVPDDARADTVRRTSADSIIVLNMMGGVTHIDSFDAKPAAPEEIRGTNGTIQTAIPGVRFGEVMPRMAASTQHFCLLRSFSHDSNDHLLSQVYMLSGRKVTMAQLMTEPNIGSIVAHMHGSRAGFPGYIAVPGTTRPGPPPYALFIGGWLGRQYDPFCSGGRPRNDDFTARVAEADEDAFNQQGLQLPEGLDVRRLVGRQSLRERLDAAIAANEDTLAQQYRTAFDMLTRPNVRLAFDLNRETGGVRDAYGRTKIGQRCLLARRLVEAGARFVMVDYGYDPEYGNLWDNHNAPVQNHPKIVDIVKYPWHLAGVDRALAALLDDLHQRGMLDRTLVVFVTEFGRTPRINREGGRDHWGAAGSLFFAGGGVLGGQVIGATDRHAANPVTAPWGPADVAASIYHAIGIDPETTLYDRQRRPLPVLPAGRVIAGLFA
ncbi:MAG: DUF1501 domain-containing protein [Planctomycetes bacterium]|nr:DUF1501 domain-containing protein [Planctomycetota bacterium]